MKRFTLLLSLLAALSLVWAASASAKVNLVRHENQYWTWYAPAGWVDAHSANGIDVTSPTGTFHVGYGFSGWYQPVTHQDVINLLLQYGGLDSFPISNVVFTSLSQPFAFAGGQREILTWTAQRQGGPKIRGVVKIDVFNDDASATYGFATTSYDGPRRKWNDEKGLLARLSKLIFYHPQSPV
ncbi:MAG: hypothetical protein AABM43_00675 [Actinomycetota bacterium]